MQRPEKSEYTEYFHTYVSIVPVGDFMNLLRTNSQEMISVYGTLPPEKQEYRYAEGKWNSKELLMHIIDVERVMAYRALVAARNDQKTILHSFDDNWYLANSNIENKTFQQVLDEFKAVRLSTEKFFETLSEEQSKSLANTETYKISARALAYIILGHSMHHHRVFLERYLN
jgi:hypothetical protein